MTEDKMRERHFQNGLRTALILFIFLFSLFLMFHTFSYDTTRHSPIIATKAWSDFGAHIPLIRSFSQGPNLTRLLTGKSVESPLFPSEPIRYHFGFYAFVGLLEKLRIRIDWALNIPSAFGMTLLLTMVYAFSFQLFKNRAVSLLSVVFVLCNGSLSFLQFFHTHPLSVHTLTDIMTNTKFSSFGPWDGSLVSAFWTINIYTNQRHLSLAYGLAISMIYLVLTYTTQKKNTRLLILSIAGMMSTLFFVHFPAAVITTLFLAWIFLVEKNTRSTLLYVALCSLPALFFLSTTTHIGSPIIIDYGYLIQKPLTLVSVCTYWFYNLGLHSILIPLGIFLSPKRVRHAIFFPLLVLFVAPNIFRFSTDMINNHKFFNFFMIIASMFSAYAIVRMSAFRIGKCIAVCLVFFLTLSGIIDFFPVINDTRGVIADQRKQQDIVYFQTHTKPTDIITNSTWFYHPASLAGRAIYSGYTYFTWSYGYDQSHREQTLLSMYRAKTLPELCTILQKNNITYVELSNTPEDYVEPNLTLWNSLPADYTNTSTGLRVFKSTSLCTTP